MQNIGATTVILGNYAMHLNISRLLASQQSPNSGPYSPAMSFSIYNGSYLDGMSWNRCQNDDKVLDYIHSDHLLLHFAGVETTLHNSSQLMQVIVCQGGAISYERCWHKISSLQNAVNENLLSDVQ